VERYVIRGGQAGYDRLRVLARARWADTAALLDRIGIRPGHRCLDVGCGAGDVSFELARLVGAGGAVTGIDMDEVKLRRAAEEAAQRGLSTVTFRVGNVNELAEPAAYDLVYARNVLQHLSQPVELLRRMWAAVRPGGVLAVEDADFDGLFCDPPNDGYDCYARLLPEAQRRLGGDPTFGRKLYRSFGAAGIAGATMDFVHGACLDGEAKTLAFSTLEAVAPAILGEGLATSEEMNAALASLWDYTQRPDTLIAEPRIFQVWARRPTG
jgi:ubiquinone/menaquinone biosynthesis C-methylase UbiE